MASVQPRRRSTRNRPAKTPLSEKAVIDAGLRILKRGGLEAVTMRAVAKELDTGPASLYVYVTDRDDLCRLMFDRVASTVDYPVADPARWREQLRQLCSDLRRALETHQGIARVALGEVPMGEGAMDGAESMLALLLAGGLAPQSAAWAADNLFLIITATAFEARIEEERIEAGEPVLHHDEVGLTAIFRALPVDRYPNVVAQAAALTAGDDDDRFLFAIDTFIDGLVAARDRAATHPS